MTAARELVIELASQQIVLWKEGENVKVSAPRGTVTPAVVKRIAALKPQLLEILDSRKTKSSALELVRIDDSVRVPFTLQQERLWFLGELNGDSTSYHIPIALKLVGRIDRGAILRALVDVQLRHEVLRTRLLEDGLGLAQIVEEKPFVHPILTTYEGAVEPYLQRQVEKPFVKSLGELWRVMIVESAPHRDELVILFTFHHLIADAWSLTVLREDLVELYRFHTGQSSTPRLPRARYRDFAAAQRSDSFANEITKQSEFWRRYLADVPPALDLPLDAPRPKIQSFKGACVRIGLSASETGEVQSFCKSRGITKFQFFLAVWDVLLFRFSRQSDFTVGLPVAARPSADLERTFGYFVNTVVQRARFNEETTFDTLLDSLRTEMLDILENQECSFDRILSVVNVERNIALPPLFQNMFVYQEGQGDFELDSNVRAKVVPIESSAAKFDLTLFVEDVVAGVGGENQLGETCIALEYDVEIFEKQTAERLVRIYDGLIRSLIEQHDQPIRAVQLPMSEHDRSVVLGRVRSTDELVHPTVVEHFRSQAKSSAQAAAVAYKGEMLSYRELDSRSDQIAAALRASGIQTGDTVSLAIPRGIELVTAVWGILKARAAFVPLDIAYPKERLSHMIRDSRSKIVLTTEAWKSLLPLGFDTVLFSKLAEWRGEVPPFDAPRADDLAYIIYTSGSTGLPKGVQIPHGAFYHYLTWAAEQYEVAIGEGAVVHSTLAFDATLTSLFTPSLVGTCVFLVGEESPIEELAELLQGEKSFSLIKITPAHLRALSPLVDERKIGRSVRYAVIGGEALRTDVLRFWYDRMPFTTFVNEYGPTETVVGCCVAFLCKEDGDSAVFERATVPIGLPIADTALYILDDSQNIVPTGFPGELYIGGKGVGDGYIGLGEASKAKFLPDPFCGKPEARMYRSGDLARILPNGELDYLGRIDTQVKLNGYRIELEEIEVALGEQPHVRTAAVVLDTSEQSRPKLVAYVESSEQFSKTEALEALQKRLPHFMVPAVIVSLESLPLTVNGKIDRARLPKAVSFEHRCGNAATIVSPRNDVERLLAEIWCDLLALSEVSIFDSFFDKGGDSILSLQVASRARSKGYSIAVRDVFECRTIAQLGLRCAAKATKDTVPAIVSEPQLLSAQRWFFAQKGPYNQYNQSVVLELRKPLEAGSLRAVLRVIEKQHDVFALRFKADGTVRRADSVFTLEDVSATGDDARQLAVEIASDAQSRLDIDKGPLARAVHIRHSSGRSFLALVFHHLIVDIVSWQTIIAEIDEGLTKFQIGAEVAFGAFDHAANQWAVGLSERAHQQFFDSELSYWKEQLAAARETISFDTASEVGVCDFRIGRVESLSESIAKDTTHKFLMDANKAFGTRPDEVLLAAASIEFSKWFNRGSVGIFLESHGREEAILDLDLSSAVGWFTAIFPHRFEVRDPSDIPQTVIDTKDGLRGIPYKGIGFGLLKVVGKLKDTGALFSTPILFNYLGQVDVGIVQSKQFLPWLGSAYNDVDPSRESSFAFELTAFVQNEKLTIQARFFPDMFEKTAVQRFIKGTLRTLESIVEYCSTSPRRLTVSDLPYLSITSAELEKLQASHGLVQDIYPPTAIKQGMIFHSSFDRDSTEYVEQLQLTLQGKLDLGGVERALQKTTADFAALRTSFLLRGEREPIEIVHVETAVAVRKLSSPQADVAEIAFSERNKKFRFDGTPLQRFCLVETGRDRNVLIWTYHHAILDGWSAARVLQRFSEYYEDPSQTFPPEVPFSNYVGWLRNEPSGENFWKAYLEEFAAPNTLRVEQLGEHQVATIQSAKFTVGKSVSQALKKVARDCEVTLNTVVSATWAILLSRYSGDSDVVFGETVSGRPEALDGVEEMVGLFINTLPVRCKISRSQTFRGFLAACQTDALARRQWSATPLSLIQQVSSVPRGESLFSTLLVFENYPVSRSLRRPFAGISVENVDAIETTNFPITVTIAPEAEIEFHIRYDSARYRERDMLRLVDCWNFVLENVPKVLDSLVSTMQILPGSAVVQQRITWNSQVAEYPTERPIHFFFESQARSTPARIAVVDGITEYTYQELDERSNQIANYLRSQGVAEKDFIGISLEPSFRMMAALLGILKAGCAYVPIDPTYPSERIKRMSTSAHLKCVVTEAAYANRFAATKAVYLDRIADEIDECSTGSIRSAANGDSICYVIFTSGTTGDPKGAGVFHRGFVNLIFSHLDLLDVGEQACTQVVSSPSFDLTQKNLFLPLMRGGRVCFLPQRHFDPKLIVLSMHRNGATWINCTPSAFYPILDAARHIGFQHLAALKAVILGGEPMSIPRMLEWLENPHNSARIINSYGPTECADVSSSFVVENPREYLTKDVPVGYPTPNVELFVLDDNQNFLPIGVPGELYVGGRGVGAGYLSAPELTAKKFVESDLPREGQRLYRTGDLVRAMEDGCIDFMGRIDHQVKVRGFRIELGEIQSVMLLHENVHEVLVMVRKDAPGCETLVAYVRPKSETTASVTSFENDAFVRELFSLVRSRLPDYMVPSAIVVLDVFPLTPNGKVNRSELPAPSFQQVSSKTVAPRDSSETTLLSIWKGILGHSEIGVDANFFDCGGHSLLAIRVMAAVEAAFGRSLPISLLFENPTVEALARAICSEQPQTGDATVVRLRSGGAKRPLFLVGGAGGMVTYLSALTKHIDPERPVFGFEPRGLDGKQEPLTTIEATAEAYVRALNAVYPTGDIELCGHSVGGKIVYEMASQLLACGRSLASITILDCCAPILEQSSVRDGYSPADWILEVVSVIEEFAGEKIGVSKASLEALEARDQYELVHRELQKVGFLPPGSSSDRLRGFVAVYREQVLAQYRPASPSSSSPLASITLVRSSESDPLELLPNEFAVLQNDPSLGWIQFAGDSVQVRSVSGNHRSMMLEPHVREVAALL